ncbi:MAG: hypothetical protein QNK05_11890, partial [Myxococcota bacterium]|nr:hypothetical protein [Myxococcota bacterium]
MEPNDPPAGDPIEIRHEGLHVTLLPEGPRVRVEWEDGPGPITLVPTPPTSFASLLGRGPRVSTRGDVKGRAAPADRVEWLRWERCGPGIRIAVEVDRGGAGVTLEMRLENRGDAPLPIEPLPVARIEGDLGALEKVVLWRDDEGHEESLMLGAAAGCTPWVAFLTGRSGYGRLHRTEAGLEASCSGVGALTPGDRLDVDRLFVGRSADPTAALDAWARRAGAEMETPMPARASQRPVGDPAWIDVDHDAGVPVREWRARLRSLRGDAAAETRVSATGPPLASAGLAHALRAVDRELDLSVASQRLWLLDMAPEDALDPTHWRTLLAGLVGGVLRLPDRGAEALRTLLPPLARESSQVAPGVLRIPLLGERIAVLLCNPTDAPVSLGIDFESLSLRGAVHAYDFAANQGLGLLASAIEPAPIRAGGARLLALTPPSERAQVIGSNLHVGMGTTEVAALRETDEGL